MRSCSTSMRPCACIWACNQTNSCDDWAGIVCLLYEPAYGLQRGRLIETGPVSLGEIGRHPRLTSACGHASRVARRSPEETGTSRYLWRNRGTPPPARPDPRPREPAGCCLARSERSSDTGVAWRVVLRRPPPSLYHRTGCQAGDHAYPSESRRRSLPSAFMTKSPKSALGLLDRGGRTSTNLVPSGDHPRLGPKP
jgi:hypothetical protein